jgi:hypothetical protein
MHVCALDNRRLALVRDTKMAGSIPQFVLDQDGTRRFVPSNRAGQAASAGRFRPACLMLGANGEEEIDTLPGGWNRDRLHPSLLGRGDFHATAGLSDRSAGLDDEARGSGVALRMKPTLRAL